MVIGVFRRSGSAMGWPVGQTGIPLLALQPEYRRMLEQCSDAKNRPSAVQICAAASLRAKIMIFAQNQ